MTLHLNASESVSHKILSFIDSLSQKGESIEIIDDTLYKFEKAGIQKGLSQLDNGQSHAVDDILAELSK